MIKFEKYVVICETDSEYAEEEYCDTLEEAVAMCKPATDKVRYYVQMVYEQYRDDESPLGDSDVIKEWVINKKGEAEEV